MVFGNVRHVGADDFLTKRVTVDRLSDVIATQAEKRIPAIHAAGLL